MTQSEKLKAREIKVEAAELMNESHATVHGDAEYVMRKVRLFHQKEVMSYLQKGWSCYAGSVI
jgi:hypothetical protein